MTTDATQFDFHGQTEEISQELRRSDPGGHFLVVYPDLPTLRETYSYYTKSALDQGNEIVLILPFYETTDNVRRILSEDSACIDVRMCEKEQSLLVMDSLKGYFGSKNGLMPFVKQTVYYASTSGRSGVSILGDMGSFFYLEKKDDLIDWELTLPSKFEGKLKGVCLYHKQDFDRMLSETEKQKLTEHHDKTLHLLPSPIDRYYP